MRLDHEENHVSPEMKDSKEYNRNPKEEYVTKEFIASSEVDSNQKEYSSQARVERIKKDAQMGGKLATGAAVVGVASLVVIGTSGLVNIHMDGHI